MTRSATLRQWSPQGAETFVTRPDNVYDLYRQAPGAIARIVGGTSYVRDVVDGGQDLLGTCPHVQGFFSPKTRLAVMHPAMGERVGSFFERTAKRVRRISPNEVAEHWQLGLVKSDLVVLTATVLRGIGPSDEQLMRAEWASLWQFPGAHTVVNGVAEAVAWQVVDQFAGEMGLIERDPRLADVEPLQRHYVAQADAVTAVAKDIGAGSGSGTASELLALPRLGSGELAVWNLARSYGGLPEFAADLPQGLVSWVELHKALADGFAGVTGDWASGHEGTVGFEQDEAAGAYWSGIITRDIRSAARRVKAGPGPFIDISKFANAIGSAGRASEAGLSANLDQLQTAWSLLESMGGAEG